MKKLLSVLLASATAVTACAGLAACEEPDTRTELIVWCPSAAQACYTALGEEFVTTYKNGEYKDYRVTCIAHEEGNAETDLGTDLSQGGDVYFAEGGQIARLIDKGYIQALDGDYAAYATAAEADNIEVSIPSTMKNGKMYAFPATADNTWFFWYDKNFYEESEITTFESVFNKAKQNNMNIMFNYNNGWYNTAFFQTAGCKMDYYEDASGNKKYGIDVNGAEGLAAAQALHKYIHASTGTMANGTGPVIISGDNATIPNGAKAGTLVAGFMGSWISGDVPSNIVPAVKAPTLNIGGTEKDMINFFTYKYAGVNPARKNVDVSMALAAFLTSEKGQEARFNATTSLPTNKVKNATAQTHSDPMKAAVAKAVNDRATHAYEQFQQTPDFWTSFEAFGNNMRKTEGATEYAGLQAAINLLQTGVIGSEAT